MGVESVLMATNGRTDAASAVVKLCDSASHTGLKGDTTPLQRSFSENVREFWQ